MGSILTPLFFKDMPLFGLDIGTSSIKVMQTTLENKQLRVVGYGKSGFDPRAILEGEIINPELIARAAHTLFEHHLVGSITSSRVALSIPARRTYAREIVLPKLKDNELEQAIRSEAEQYIPRSLDELYLDSKPNSQDTTSVTVYTVAAPQKLIDSYVQLARLLGLEAVSIEPTMSADARMMGHDTTNAIPSVLIDFGAKSADMAVVDGMIAVNGTVESGGDLFTDRIMQTLQTTRQQAQTIKVRYGIGLSKKQAQIRQAIEPLLQQTTREIKRMIRYHDDHAVTKRSIEQVVTMGGGANMPGLSDYLTESLRLPVRLFDPWQVLDAGRLQPPAYADRSTYTTVGGLSLVRSKELFQ